MPLTMASIGETNTIRKVGGNEETKRFLENLGFVAGCICHRWKCYCQY